MNNGALILLLLASVLSAPILYLNEPNFSFSEVSLNAKVINKTPSPCYPKINSTAAEIISCSANSWRVPTDLERFSEKTI